MALIADTQSTNLRRSGINSSMVHGVVHVVVGGWCQIHASQSLHPWRLLKNQSRLKESPPLFCRGRDEMCMSSLPISIREKQSLAAPLEYQLLHVGADSTLATSRLQETMTRYSHAAPSHNRTY
jgi:hypothetical protein